MLNKYILVNKWVMVIDAALNDKNHQDLLHLSRNLYLIHYI